MIDQAVEDIISDTIRARLSDAIVDRIVVSEDTGCEGDPILRVVIVVDANNESLDRAKMVGLVRHLRPALSSIGVKCPSRNFSNIRNGPPDQISSADAAADPSTWSYRDL